RAHSVSRGNRSPSCRRQRSEGAVNEGLKDRAKEKVDERDDGGEQPAGSAPQSPFADPRARAVELRRLLDEALTSSPAPVRVTFGAEGDRACVVPDERLTGTG